MIDDLINKVWSNPRYHSVSSAIERDWLERELGMTSGTPVGQDLALKLSQAAAILACSNSGEHRASAYRVATYAFELYGDSLTLDETLRVIFARIGNFPAMGTRKSVECAINRLPWRLAGEELQSAGMRTIVVNEQEILLTDFQNDLWRRLVECERLAVSAPTSAGKSFVLQNFLVSKFESGEAKNVVYLVPTRALIAQVSADLSERFGTRKERAPKIMTVPISEGVALPDRGVYVLTQERTQLLMQAQVNFVPDLIIVDEAHSIQDGARGVLLQWVIDDLLSRKSDVQIVFASPTVRNLEVFSALFGLSGVTCIKTDEATVSQNFILANVESATKGLVSFRMAGRDGLSSAEIGRKSLGETLASRIDKLVHIPMSMAGTGSSIVYANGPSDAEKIALQISEGLKDREPTEGRLLLAQLAREVVHPKYVLADCVKVGVGFHYGNIPTVLRQAVERAFKNGDLDFLVCTSTLLQGVNLPAKHIFMISPEKGRSNPLSGADFWNLSGRAGRLRHEFQGNIFLIDYEKWKSQPLGGARDAIIRPAMQVCLSDERGNLINLIRQDQGIEKPRDPELLDSSFVRLFSDFDGGTLDSTFSKAGIGNDKAACYEVQEALRVTAESITLPGRVLKRSGSVSVHKQQSLFDYLLEKIAQGGREGAVRLIPAHPRQEDAFQSYADILQICHRFVLGIDETKGLHRFHALLAVRWMRGWPLPRVIDAQIVQKLQQDIRKTIRDTLDLIEGEIRYQVSRLFGVYESLLSHALAQAGLADLRASLPTIPLFLEVGASDQTMISFIAVGLSRTTAMLLNDLAADKNLTVDDAIAWLRNRPLESLGVSPLLLGEIRGVLEGYVP